MKFKVSEHELYDPQHAKDLEAKVFGDDLDFGKFLLISRLERIFWMF